MAGDQKSDCGWHCRRGHNHIPAVVATSQQFGDMLENALGSREGGVMEKIFGTNKELASMNIALIICAIMILVGLVINDQQYWDKIITIIAAMMGYIFGRGGKSE